MATTSTYHESYYLRTVVPGQVLLSGTASATDSSFAALTVAHSVGVPLTAQVITTAGLTPIYQAATLAGDTMAADSRVFLHIKNGGVSSMTVTLVTPAVVDTVLPVDDRVISVGAASDRMIAVPVELYQDPITKLASITYSAVTSVTVAALRSR